ncbi:hypothetical protein F5B17DRAFT_383002 [Nemania serpens]|nr:hypothetical protein F5B17DRAFT_383002 [Nemania serpens]
MLIKPSPPKPQSVIAYRNLRRAGRTRTPRTSTAFLALSNCMGLGLWALMRGCPASRAIFSYSGSPGTSSFQVFCFFFALYTRLGIPTSRESRYLRSTHVF